MERFAGMEKVDLVVSDVVMPTMDGPAMVREMRKKRPALRRLMRRRWLKQHGPTLGRSCWTGTEDFGSKTRKKLVRWPTCVDGLREWDRNWGQEKKNTSRS